jgi:hypothetical protein
MTEQEMNQVFSAGDRVRVEYSFRKFFEGCVVFTEKCSGLEWVYVRPDDLKMIYTFGSARDMDNQYKGYIANDPVLGKVTKI